MKRAAIITIFTVVISVGVLSAGKAQPLVMLHYHAWAEYNHAAGVAGFTELINETAAALGYIVDHSDDPNLLQPEILKGYDIIIFDNNCYVASPIVSGNAANKQAFRDYMEQGGKWLGLHAGPAYAEQGWDWFRYDFFGCEFIRHGYGTFDLKIDDEVYDDPELTAMIEFLGLPQYATVEEETYEWGKCGTEGDGSLRGDPRVKIIQTMEPGMYNDHAYSWAKDLDGGGRMVFTSINHDATVWDMDDRYHRQMLVGYLKYLAGDFAAVEGCMLKAASIRDMKNTIPWQQFPARTCVSPSVLPHQGHGRRYPLMQRALPYLFPPLSLSSFQISMAEWYTLKGAGDPACIDCLNYGRRAFI
jgi:hypothetical protein